MRLLVLAVTAFAVACVGGEPIDSGEFPDVVEVVESVPTATTEAVDGIIERCGETRRLIRQIQPEGAYDSEATRND